MPTMSLLRLPVVLAAATSMHIAVTAPHTAALDERVSPSTFREAIVNEIVIKSHLLTVTLIWSVALGELVAILFPDFSSIAAVDLQPPPSTVPILWTVGGLCIISAGVIRKLCYRTLGRFFTFELSIQKEHRLVTEGPYSIVRHPAYTGTLLLTTGLFLMHGNPDSWLRASGILEFTFLRKLLLGWAIVTFAATIGLFARAVQEDRLMRDQFGEEWDRWASVVRYRIVPGIY